MDIIYYTLRRRVSIDAKCSCAKKGQLHACPVYLRSCSLVSLTLLMAELSLRGADIRLP